MTKTKTQSFLGLELPIMGVPDGKDSKDPAVRQAWLDQRAGGFTATEARDWGSPSKKREIIQNKVTMVTEDLSHIPAIAHGNIREPIIAEWIQGRYGIEPCNHVYARHDNERHLASPDGISLHPFTRELVVGTAEAILAEIKTSKHDLHPGHLDDDRVLVEIDQESHFARSNYYTQMQWQMYVMNATFTLFVWEQHNGQIDPSTGTFTPVGPPQVAWIPRDEALIEKLVTSVAPKALAEIDAARAAIVTDGLPPAGAFPSEDAALIADYIKALDAEKVAAAAKKKAWDALGEKYKVADLDADDVSIKQEGFAQITVATTEKDVPELQRDAMLKRAPKLVAQYEALVKRHTKMVPKRTRKMTITPKKES